MTTIPTGRTPSFALCVINTALRRYRIVCYEITLVSNRCTYGYGGNVMTNLDLEVRSIVSSLPRGISVGIAENDPLDKLLRIRISFRRALRISFACEHFPQCTGLIACGLFPSVYFWLRQFGCRVYIKSASGDELKETVAETN